MASSVRRVLCPVASVVALLLPQYLLPSAFYSWSQVCFLRSEWKDSHVHPHLMHASHYSESGDRNGPVSACNDHSQVSPSYVAFFSSGFLLGVDFPVRTSHSCSSVLVLDEHVWAPKAIWLILYNPVVSPLPAHWSSVSGRQQHFLYFFFIVCLDPIGVYDALQILNEHGERMQEFLLALFLWCLTANLYLPPASNAKDKY